MILLSRLNGSELWLNPLLMESVEQTPDTVITMTNGHKYVVQQTAAEIAEQTRSYFRTIGLAGAVAGKEEQT
jgi:flagellar protein FlbD